MSDIRLALVGCGAAARTYYLPALRKRRVSASGLYFVDKKLSHARQLAEQLGAPQYTDNHLEILDRVDGAILALPHFLHYPIAMDCLNKGVHVLCEKPLAETPDEVADMIAEAERHRVTLSVNNTRRLYPAPRHIHHLVSSGAIGPLVSINIVEGEKFAWESATNFYVDPTLSAKGVLLDLGAHVLDLVCWWVAGRPEVFTYEDDSFGGPESVAHLVASTATCDIDVRLTRLIDIDSRYVITGELATIEWNPSDWNTLRIRPRSGRARRIRLKMQARTYQEFVEALVTNFVNTIKQHERPLIPAASVMDSIGLIEECYQKRRRLKMPWYDALEARLCAP